MQDGERRYGHPRTEEERAQRHAERYPGEPLPPRGTGLAGIGQSSCSGLKVLGVVATALLVGWIVIKGSKPK